MKKFLSILLAVVLTLSLCTVAFAAEPTITVDNVGDATLIDVYKILKCETTTTGSYKYTFVNDAYQDIFVETINTEDGAGSIKADATAADILVYITNNHASDNGFAEALADALKTTATAGAATYSKTASNAATDGKYVFNVELGYYLLVDATSYDTIKQSAVSLMLQPAAPEATVVLKTAAYTKPAKTVAGDNAGTVKIGDTLTYTLAVEIPNYSKYTDAAFSLVDTLGTGLKFVSLESAKVGETTFTPSAVPAADATGTLTFGYTDIKTTFDGLIGETLTIVYKAQVTSDAPITGLVNSVDARENGATIEGNDITVYTYGFKANKVNEYDETLDGVEFAVYQLGEDGSKNYLKFDNVTVDGEATEKYLYNSASSNVSLITANGGKLDVFGLDNGTYYLEEVETLAGYTKLADPVMFEIKNEINTAEFAKIVNYTGVQLPSTGGMGTTIFSIVGILMMVSAGLFLALNRKKIFSK